MLKTCMYSVANILEYNLPQRNETSTHFYPHLIKKHLKLPDLCQR